jgi:hypothetical protein
MKLEFNERFKLSTGVVPGVFIFRTINHRINLMDMKEYFYIHGVQNSVFYGEEAFFIPCHQNLTKVDLLYFLEVIKSFIKNQSK